MSSTARAGDAVAGRVAATLCAADVADGGPILALVSGGADSTLLLLVLAELGRAHGRDLAALHVEHGLRGDASGADAASCRALCARLGVPLAIVPGPVEPGGDLERRLRDVRRAAALAHAGTDLDDGDGPADHDGERGRGRLIATGHTASDRVETVLYRLATAGSARALAVLPPRDGRWLRPLADLTRDEVRAELRRRGEPWRDDASNDDRRFARNRIRAEVVPALVAVNAAAERNIAYAAAEADRERDLLDRLADALVEADGSVRLDRLAAAHPALAPLTLRRAARAVGCSLTRGDVAAILAMRWTGREERTLPGAARALREGPSVRFAGP